MAIRQATVADIDAMHAVRTGVRENRLTEPGRVTDRDYCTRLEVDGRGWVCEVDGEVVGFGIVDLARRNIWALFVAPGFERRGIGSALLTAMIDWAFAQGKEPLWLTTAPNTRAARFYCDAGWRQTGVDERGELRFELALAADANRRMTRGQEAVSDHLLAVIDPDRA